MNHSAVAKLYFTRARHSMKLGASQYSGGASATKRGIHTSRAPSSTARMQRRATASRFRPCTFGSFSATASASSTADVRNAPSTVDGSTKLNAMAGCSWLSAR
jgi:hypothetical protein